MENCNKITSVLTDTECYQFRNIFLKNTYTLTGLGDKCYGIDVNNTISYPWVKKVFLPKINQFFDVELKLIFASYSSFTKPFAIHRDDYKPIPNDAKGTHYISCLIPISVDNNKDLCHLASTIIFKEGENNNAELDHKNHLSHCDLEQLKTHPIDKIFTWNIGDMIWWKSELNHCSGHFKNFKTKECFVVHTYVE